MNFVFLTLNTLFTGLFGRKLVVIKYPDQVLTLKITGRVPAGYRVPLRFADAYDAFLAGESLPFDFDLEKITFGDVLSTTSGATLLNQGVLSYLGPADYLNARTVSKETRDLLAEFPASVDGPIDQMGDEYVEKFLRVYPNPKRLEFQRYANDAMIERLAGRGVLDVKIRNNANLTDRSLTALRGVEFLDVVGCTGFTDAGFENLADIRTGQRGLGTRLKQLIARDTNLSDAAFPHFGELIALAVGGKYSAGKFNNFEPLQKLRQLTCYENVDGFGTLPRNLVNLFISVSDDDGATRTENICSLTSADLERLERVGRGQLKSLVFINSSIPGVTRIPKCVERLELVTRKRRNMITPFYHSGLTPVSFLDCNVAELTLNNSEFVPIYPALRSLDLINMDLTAQELGRTQVVPQAYPIQLTRPNLGAVVYNLQRVYMHGCQVDIVNFQDLTMIQKVELDMCDFRNEGLADTRVETFVTQMRISNPRVFYCMTINGIPATAYFAPPYPPAAGQTD